MEITNTNKSEMHNIFALISGLSGSGKTYALGTLPENETLIISMESGLLTLKDKNIEVWIIKTIQDLIKCYEKLEAREVNFKNICVDSLTELSDICFTTLKPNYTKSQNFALYEEFTSRMTSIIKKFRDLKGYNIFMTSLLKESENGMMIDVAQKSLGYRLPVYFDFVWTIKSFTKDDKTQRALVCDNTVMPFLKSRSNKISEYEKVNLQAIIEKVLA